jgi:hypothetical protein
MRGSVFIFGAAEKGAFCKPIFLSSVEELLDTLGHPPSSSEGIYYAIQTLLFKIPLTYFRVAEEGLDLSDYMAGLKWLKKTPQTCSPSALCLPGTSHPEILQAAFSICHLHESLLIISEKDLYDCLT